MFKVHQSRDGESKRHEERRPWRVTPRRAAQMSNYITERLLCTCHLRRGASLKCAVKMVWTVGFLGVPSPRWHWAESPVGPCGGAPLEAAGLSALQAAARSSSGFRRALVSRPLRLTAPRQRFVGRVAVEGLFLVLFLPPPNARSVRQRATRGRMFERGAIAVSVRLRRGWLCMDAVRAKSLERRWPRDRRASFGPPGVPGARAPGCGRPQGSASCVVAPVQRPRDHWLERLASQELCCDSAEAGREGEDDVKTRVNVRRGERAPWRGRGHLELR